MIDDLLELSTDPDRRTWAIVEQALAVQFPGGELLRWEPPPRKCLARRWTNGEHRPGPAELAALRERPNVWAVVGQVQAPGRAASTITANLRARPGPDSGAYDAVCRLCSDGTTTLVYARYRPPGWQCGIKPRCASHRQAEPGMLAEG